MEAELRVDIRFLIPPALEGWTQQCFRLQSFVRQPLCYQGNLGVVVGVGVGVPGGDG